MTYRKTVRYTVLQNVRQTEMKIKTQAISFRCPSDLYDALSSFALDNGIAKDGKPIVSEALITALRIGLGLSDSVSQPVSQDVLQQQIDALAGKLESTRADFDDRLGKLLNLINLPVNQVESIVAPVQVAENKAIKIENHPKAVGEGVQVANTARTVGKVKPITYDTNPDGSVRIKSIRGLRSETFKKLSDAELASIGVVRRGSKFYPIDAT